MQKKGHKKFVLKAQVLGGGRGRGHFIKSGLQGGVQVVDTPEQVRDLTARMVNDHLVTKQSGDEGFSCGTVYIVETVDIDTEVYIALTLDRANQCPTFIYSSEGGMAIEDVAEATPEKIHKIHINMQDGLTDADLEDVPKNLGFEDNAEEIREVFRNIYKLSVEKDADMVEVNPMVRLKSGNCMAIDGKITVDDNAAFRQTEVADMEDQSDKDEKERAAEAWDLSYIPIGGNIGCLVNGAGLAMSTMDLIKLHGGEPANFLDVGGSAIGQAMVEAMKIVHNSSDVDAIFINIFGGILKCDQLVESVIAAHKENKFTKPIILRLKGTNVERAEELLAGKEKEMGITFTHDFDLGAKMAVKAANDIAAKRS